MMKNTITYKISVFYKLFKAAYNELNTNDPLRMAGATAFFTTFALPPILIILIQVLGLFFNPSEISHKLFQDLSEIIGIESMQQVIQTLTGFRSIIHTWYFALIGFLFMLFIATTLFLVIKNSLNQIWKIRMQGTNSFWFTINNRLASIGIILFAGVLFVAGLFMDFLQNFIGAKVLYLNQNQLATFNFFIDLLYSIIAVTIWLTILFRYLPDGRPRWKVAVTGAFITSLLFNIGKLILHLLLTYKNVDIIYRASASVVLLLLFVFYSSLILFLGSAFTSVWADYKKTPIRPLKNAVNYKLENRVNT